MCIYFFYVPDMFLSTSYILTPLIFKTLWGKYYYYSHFVLIELHEIADWLFCTYKKGKFIYLNSRDEETDREIKYITQGHSASKCQSRDKILY